MATDTQSQFRKRRNPNKVTNQWTPKNDTVSEPGKHFFYNSCGHQHTKRIQKTVEIQTFTNLWILKNHSKSEPETQRIYDTYGLRHTQQIQKTIKI